MQMKVTHQSHHQTTMMAMEPNQLVKVLGLENNTLAANVHTVLIRKCP